MTLLEQFERGDIRALSRLISCVENRDEGFRALLERLYPRAGLSVRVGVTGPPGAGKSTLVNGLAGFFLHDGSTAGIIAVDPTSPFTGGALLGDRVRMNEFPTDVRVYFRSMATRGATGGLAAATENVAILYDAFGFDVTLIETVGVGQMELDIIDTCDVVVVVIVPESGDAVQMLKAGLMEIADVFCLNKADRPGAERLAADLRQTLETRKAATPLASKSGALPTQRHALITCENDLEQELPIIQTEAVTGRNVDALHRAIGDHVNRARESGRFDQNRRSRLRKKILNILNDRFRFEFINHSVSEAELEEAIDRIRAGKTNPYRVGAELYQRFTRK